MPTTQRKALCVGVNHYKNIPDATLRGCVPDAQAMSSLLKDVFKIDDIDTLLDGEATKANIINKLKDMIAGAKAGKYNYLVFTMSSHGSQVPDLDHDETTGTIFDEAFCPYDLAWAGNQWDPKHIIVDDELHGLFVQLPPNVKLVAFLDTCHAGTGLKAFDLLPTRKARYLPPQSFEAFKKVENLRPRSLSRKLIEKENSNHILWAACRDDQTSMEGQFGGKYHGAFTYFLCNEMKKASPRTTWAQILTKIRSDLALAGYSQVPQLETNATQRDLPSIPTNVPEHELAGVS